MNADMDARARELTSSERAAVAAVAVLAGGLGLIGFANSFARVAAAAVPWFGALAPTVPLGIDLGILAFSALDLVLARLDMRPRWLRLIPWGLTAATVYLNVTGEPSWFARIAHAVFPLLWVVVVEAGAHVIRVRAGLAAGTLMDRIRPARWLLAPIRTAALWRRMILWEIRSYPAALERERARLLALTSLQDAYGQWAWRWKAPRRSRALYRLGEHDGLADAAATPPAAPALCTEPDPDTSAEPVASPVPDLSELVAGTGPQAAAGPVRQPVPDSRPDRSGKPAGNRSGKRGPNRSGKAGAGRSRKPVTAEDAEAEFSPEIAAGQVPSLYAIRTRLHVGHAKAQDLRVHIARQALTT